MAIFNRKPIYISDRGDQYQLEEMEPTHLMNAINHHRKQVDTIDWCLETLADLTDLSNLHYRRITLVNTIEALVTELLKRDPDDDYNDDN